MPAWKRAFLFGGGTTVVVLCATAAAPVTVAAGLLGGLGVITGYGASLAGACGTVGALGVMFDDYFSSEQVRTAETIAAGYAARSAKQSETMDRLLAQLRALEVAAREWAEFTDDMIRLGRVLVGAAWADVDLEQAGSVINPTEVECIRATLFSASSMGLPADYADRVQQVLAERVTFKQAVQAFEELRSLGLRELVPSLLPVIMASDQESEQIDHKEQKFLDAWETYFDEKKSAL